MRAGRAVALIVVGACLGGAGSALADPDLAAGEHWLKLACGECHTLGKVIDGKGAPDLDGVVGRKIASTDFSGYSNVLKSAGAAGQYWSPQLLYNFIAKPDAIFPGNAMDFFGLIHDSDRQNVIAVLEEYSPEYKPPR